MSLVTLTNFISITKADGSNPESDFTPNLFQNGKYNDEINGHSFLSFIYQGATRNRSGDNLEANLILANNEISMSYAKKAVDRKFHIKVETFLMKEDFTVNKLLTSETWLAASLAYDPTTIEILLSSAIDAVGANAPNRVLTRNLVGQLPVTGSIQAR